MDFETWFILFENDIHKTIMLYKPLDIDSLIESMYMEYLTSLHDTTDYSEIETVITYNPLLEQ